MDNVRELVVDGVPITLEFDEGLLDFFVEEESNSFKIRGDKYALQVTTTIETFQQEVANLIVNELITYMHEDINISIVFMHGIVYVVINGKPNYFETLDAGLEYLAKATEGMGESLYKVVKNF